MTHDKRLDIVRDELIDQVVIELHPSFIDRIVLASEGYNSRPRDGESISLGSDLLHHFGSV